MSGIYIPGMEMPIDCYDCLLSSEFNLYEEDGYCVSGMECPLLNQVIDDDSKRLPDCPLIHVPDHGRLISADLLKADFTGNFTQAYPTGLVWAMIDDAPTIIPGEEKS